MTTVVPVRDGERPIGVYLVGEDTAVYRPAVDVTKLGLAALATVAVSTVAVAAAVVLRRRPAVGTLTMGPGGWVSFKRTAAPPVRDAARPWWARVLRAHELVVRR
ncbi:MAG TPA: hypothetical protein VFH03_15260 [Actinoplanes sp.]|nr:hypothetical protein [Actinoplanes sp.]